MSIVAIQTAIAARLQDRVNVKRIYTAAEIAQTEEQSQLTPNLALMYNGYRTGEQLGLGQIQELTFEFLVIVTVRNAYNTATHDGARDEASPLIDAVMAALLGYRPVQGMGTLRLADAPAAAFSEAGFGYYPVAFEISRTYRGTT